MLITDTEFENELKNPENHSIMKKASYKYGAKLSPEQKLDCEMVSLWKALQKKKEKPDINFGACLYNGTKWLCMKELYENIANVEYIDNLSGEISSNTEIDDLLDRLPYGFGIIIRQRFIDRMTLKEIGKENGYSHQTARNKLVRAINELEKRI